MQGYNCILIFKGDSALFCKRTTDPYLGKFNLPGGKIEHGENGFDAAYRELLEETGISTGDVTLSHMMDFTYHNQGCYVEIYVGTLNRDVQLISEKHPLQWLSLDEDFFDLDKFASEGNIGHIMEQVRCYGTGVFDYSAKAPTSFSERILCYGDSNTFGWNPMTGLRYEEDVRWTGILQKLLGPNARVLEEGCNGRTTVFEKPDEPWKSGIMTLRPVLNTCKPIDRMILMLGSNDLKTMFGASPEDIADGIGQLVHTTIEFTEEKQGFIPKILLVSPCEIGADVVNGPFNESFDDTAHERSLKLAELYRAVADEFPEYCQFFDAATIIKPSEIDSLHLMPEAHKKLAEAFYKLILQNEEAKNEQQD